MHPWGMGPFSGSWFGPSSGSLYEGMSRALLEGHKVRKDLFEDIPGVFEDIPGGENQTFSYSSSSRYSPELGHVSHSSRFYKGADGHMKKIVERVLDDKSITESWEGDVDDPEKAVKTLSLRQIEEDKLQEFEDEWDSRCEAVYGEKVRGLEGPDEFAGMLPSSPKRQEQLEETEETKKAEPKGRRRRTKSMSM